jgi:hypothetical protein
MLELIIARQLQGSVTSRRTTARRPSHLQSSDDCRRLEPHEEFSPFPNG